MLFPAGVLALPHFVNTATNKCIEFFVYVRFHITYWLAEYNSINKNCWNLGHGVDFPVLFLKLKNIKVSYRNSSYGDKDKICLGNLNMFGKCNRFLLLSCDNDSLNHWMPLNQRFKNKKQQPQGIKNYDYLFSPILGQVHRNIFIVHSFQGKCWKKVLNC